MRSLQARIILLFVAVTVLPLATNAWVWLSLLDRSLGLNTAEELDRSSKSLENTGRELYRRARHELEAQAAAGLPPARKEAVREETQSRLAGKGGDTLEYRVRHGYEMWVYSTPLHASLGDIRSDYARARASLEKAKYLRAGLIVTFIVLSAMIWLLGLAALIYFARRISKPIRELTAGLTAVAAGDLDRRLEVHAGDEIGRAASAFNHMSAHLVESRDKLVYVARLESWQALARKMAHEIKNSLTPIRLTVEEMVARSPNSDRVFLEQASQIVVDEVLSLERRVRAFSEFGSEPEVILKPLDVNEVLAERVALLKTAHPEIVYSTRFADDHPHAYADEDLVKGLLTNLLENAAQAVEPQGVVLGITSHNNGHVAIEIHDSGPGLKGRKLFEPTISFKPGGMGLGLSIARKSALLCGGDIELVNGELGGAAFRVLLPTA